MPTPFKLRAPYKPTGDQPQAIEKLTQNLKDDVKHQTLLGVTGSGKTFTMASVVERIQRPTLVISHNKTLAWQLYQEFKDFFPDNAVEYFVSYYDYYQPEAYIPQSDTYIEKDARINEKIDKLRHEAVQTLLSRKDTLVVASVSCIYNLGSPEDYESVTLRIQEGQKIARRELLTALIKLGYARNDIAPKAGNFSSRGDAVTIFPPTGETPTVVTLENATIKKLSQHSEKLPTKSGDRIPNTIIYPAHFWVTPEDKLVVAALNIRQELAERLEYLKKENKIVEAQRLERRTLYDLELMQETGWCHGIENYSRQLEFRAPDSSPYTLLDYFKHVDLNFLTIIDESHISIPQIRGMYEGDRARKNVLIDYGFRLPSAIDNRPLRFTEFEERVGQRVYVSATPGAYELAHSKDESDTPKIVEQLLRPTGLLDPGIEIRPTKLQMKDAISEIKKRIEKKQRSLVITLTKRLAEDIAEYLKDESISVAYLHSDIHTLERPKILYDLRKGKYDVLVGINLLREGLDLPETSLVIIFDADKEGFLRNDTTLIQIMGRAARHEEGRAIMYADKTTGSMQRAIEETDRRRNTQKEYNAKHNITPRSIQKKLYALPDELFSEEAVMDNSLDALSVKELEIQMKRAAKELDFEKAAHLRDAIKKMKKKI